MGQQPIIIETCCSANNGNGGGNTPPASANLKTGSVQIANGTYSGFLAPAGVNGYSSLANLVSITVEARRSNFNDSINNGIGDKIVVETNNNDFVLLEGEERTYSVEDNNTLS
ncbi:MAG: hypothetical protein ACRDBG_16050, partial [Waterburya sp.]